MTTKMRLPITSAAPAPQDPRWETNAACRTVDPDLFFPVGSSKAARAQTAEAKSVCMQCPVRVQCLNWAMETEQPHGVLGGMSQEERWQIAPVTPGVRSTAPLRCNEAREQILAWRRKEKTLQWIADRLGVDRGAVRRAVRQFAAEEQAAQQTMEIAA